MAFNIDVSNPSPLKWKNSKMSRTLLVYRMLYPKVWIFLKWDESIEQNLNSLEVVTALLQQIITKLVITCSNTCSSHPDWPPNGGKMEDFIKCIYLSIYWWFKYAGNTEKVDVDYGQFLTYPIYYLMQTKPESCNSFALRSS